MALVLRKTVLPKNVSLLKCMKGRSLASTANKNNPAPLPNDRRKTERGQLSLTEKMTEHLKSLCGMQIAVKDLGMPLVYEEKAGRLKLKGSTYGLPGEPRAYNTRSDNRGPRKPKKNPVTPDVIHVNPKLDTKELENEKRIRRQVITLVTQPPARVDSFPYRKAGDPATRDLKPCKTFADPALRDPFTCRTSTDAAPCDPVASPTSTDAAPRDPVARWASTDAAPCDPVICQTSTNAAPPDPATYQTSTNPTPRRSRLGRLGPRYSGRCQNTVYTKKVEQQETKILKKEESPTAVKENLETIDQKSDESFKPVCSCCGCPMSKKKDGGSEKSNIESCSFPAPSFTPSAPCCYPPPSVCPPCSPYCGYPSPNVCSPCSMYGYTPCCCGSCCCTPTCCKSSCPKPSSPKPCGPCFPGCCPGCSGCCLPPMGCAPRCVQYMTGYYYYPYGVWFCGPYQVGTCCPMNCCCGCGCGPCCGPCGCCCCVDGGNPCASYSSPLQSNPQIISPFSNVSRGLSNFNPCSNGFNPCSSCFNPSFSCFNPCSGSFNPFSSSLIPYCTGFNQCANSFSPWSNGFNPCSNGFNPCTSRFSSCVSSLNPCPNSFNPCPTSFNPCTTSFNPCTTSFNPCAACCGCIPFSPDTPSNANNSLGVCATSCSCLPMCPPYRSTNYFNTSPLLRPWYARPCELGNCSSMYGPCGSCGPYKCCGPYDSLGPSGISRLVGPCGVCRGGPCVPTWCGCSPCGNCRYVGPCPPCGPYGLRQLAGSQGYYTSNCCPDQTVPCAQYGPYAPCCPFNGQPCFPPPNSKCGQLFNSCVVSAPKECDFPKVGSIALSAHCVTILMSLLKPWLLGEAPIETMPKIVLSENCVSILQTSPKSIVLQKLANMRASTTNSSKKLIKFSLPKSTLNQVAKRTPNQVANTNNKSIQLRANALAALVAMIVNGVTQTRQSSDDVTKSKKEKRRTKTRSLLLEINLDETAFDFVTPKILCVIQSSPTK